MLLSFPWLLSLHSLLRWFLLISLLLAVYKAYIGWRYKKPFTKTDNAIRHWTATIAHIQLTVGCILYFKSTLISYFWKHVGAAIHQMDVSFFGVIHFVLMLAAITIITIGSAIARRTASDHEKFKTMLIWFSIALLIIFVAIPWPFSPLAGRPYTRQF